MTLNLNDKIWNDHDIHEMDGGKSLLFADRHFADQATSPLAFELCEAEPSKCPIQRYHWRKLIRSSFAQATVSDLHSLYPVMPRNGSCL